MNITDVITHLIKTRGEHGEARVHRYETDPYGDYEVLVTDVEYVPGFGVIIS